MHWVALCFAGGVLALHFLPDLPGSGSVGIVLALAVSLRPVLRGRWPFVVAVAAGFAWAWWQADERLGDRLAADLEGRSLEVAGEIGSVVRRRGAMLQFDLLPRDEGLPGRIRLNWYEATEELRPGEIWRLHVRLRRPRGTANPGARDREARLFSRGIGAVGYVIGKRDNGRLDAGEWRAALLAMRTGLAARIDAAVDHHRMSGILTGLTVGVRDAVSPEQWRVFAATGTTHLMAISGLHIGLVAALVLLLVRAGCTRLPGTTRIDPLRAGLFAGLAAAAGYALLAGFTLPTRRALTMLAVAFIAILARKGTTPFTGLSLSLGVVLLLDPLAPVGAGFWLSFSAVAAILFSMLPLAPRPCRPVRFLRLQLAVSLGVLPAQVALMGSVSLMAPVVNLVAIPLFGILIIPGALVGVACLVVWPEAGVLLLQALANLLDGLWPWLAAADFGFTTLPRPGAPAATLLAVAVVLLLAPRGVPGRWLGAPLLATILLGGAPRLPHGSFSVAVLDVGQGLSALIRTRDHSLLFDTGASFASGSSMADYVVLPFLRQRGIGRLDTLMLSHPDIDHVGGAAQIAQAYPRAEILASYEHDLGVARRPCVRGMTWEWDGVPFRVLHPEADDRMNENDRSCVLMVGGVGGRVLLTGDIQAEAEWRLVSREADLRADIVVAPHHGSATSSSRALVEASQAAWVIFAAGYRNRWKFPAAEVVERWRQAGVAMLTTADTGAVEFLVVPGAGALEPRLHRSRGRRYWTVP